MKFYKVGPFSPDGYKIKYTVSDIFNKNGKWQDFMARCMHCNKFVSRKTIKNGKVVSQEEWVTCPHCKNKLFEK